MCQKVHTLYLYNPHSIVNIFGTKIACIIVEDKTMINKEKEQLLDQYIDFLIHSINTTDEFNDEWNPIEGQVKRICNLVGVE